jgi:hypothetical protein
MNINKCLDILFQLCFLRFDCRLPIFETLATHTRSKEVSCGDRQRKRDRTKAGSVFNIVVSGRYVWSPTLFFSSNLSLGGGTLIFRKVLYFSNPAGP